MRRGFIETHNAINNAIVHKHDYQIAKRNWRIKVTETLGASPLRFCGEPLIP